MKARRVLLLVLVLAAGGFVFWAATRKGEPAPSTTGPLTGNGTAPATGQGAGMPAVPGNGAPAGGISFTHPSECRSCHPEAYEEWSSSMHAKAVSDPEVRALSDDFRSTECQSCHMPQPIHSSPVGGRVFERSSRIETGVDCLSCHLLPDGGVAARRDIPGAPCRPRKVETLGLPVTCQGCHDQHRLVENMETLFTRPDPAKGAILTVGRPETCVDCHMPPSARAALGEVPAREGRSHSFPGGHSVEMLRGGLSLAARIEGGEVVVETTSTGVGHRVPDDSRHRSLNVWVTVTTEGGIKFQDRTEIAEYRMYYRQDFRENTNLRPGETAVSRLYLPSGIRGTALVELVYCLNPILKEKKESLSVHRVELEFDTTN